MTAVRHIRMGTHMCIALLRVDLRVQPGVFFGLHQTFIKQTMGIYCLMLNKLPERVHTAAIAVSCLTTIAAVVQPGGLLLLQGGGRRSPHASSSRTTQM